MSENKPTSPLPADIAAELIGDGPAVTPAPAVQADTPVIPPADSDTVIEEFPEQAATAPAQSENTAPFKPMVSKQNVTVEDPVFLPFSEELDNGESIDLPSDFAPHVVHAIDAAPNLRLDSSEDAKRWSNIFQAGLGVVTLEDQFKGALENPDSQWSNVVHSREGKLRPITPVYGHQSSELSGERGMLHMMHHMRMGTVFRFPLWNSGFWITLKSPGEVRLLELYRELVADQIQLGRSSYGMVFSNEVVFTAERLVNVALEMLFSATLKSEANFNVRDAISTHDVWTLAWGLACVIWNNGVIYDRSCTHDPNKCQHTVKETLNITKMLWVNYAGLTQSQLTHMSKRNQGEVTLEQVNRYREEMLCASNRSFTLLKGRPEEVRVVLRVPNVTQFITAGHEWIDGLSNMVLSALGMDASINERNQHINSRSRATAMRQRTHWVHALEYDTDGNTYTMTDRETIANTLNTLSANDKVREEFEEAVQKFIDSSTVTVLGVPSYDCPKCHGPHQTETDTVLGKSIIPMDVYETFFKLLVQRVARINNR